MDAPIATPVHRLQLKGISKFFPGVRALSSVDLTVNAGEVHAICGENGAGKSTLMKILTGNYKPDEGRIFVNGEEVHIQHQKHAQELGISIVYQEKSLVGKLTVAENIFPGRKPTNRFGLIDHDQLRKKTSTLLHSMHLPGIDPGERLENLSVAHQQMIEISKALAQEPRILILDEPTASLTEREVSTLFQIVRQLRDKGVSIIYISHRMSEIFEIADTITVLKDGVMQGSFPAKEMTMEGLIRLMVGRELTAHAYRSHVGEEVALEVTNLSGAAFHNVSFKIRKGEILGLAGLVGAGRSEVARAIFGAEPAVTGEIWVNGLQARMAHPADAIAHRVGYLPEDRKEEGLFMSMEIGANVISGDLRQAGGGFWIDPATVTSIAERYRALLRIKTPDTHQQVLNLSGGNQQKVVMAKWLSLSPAVFIVDEPTHGVDVGAKMEIYEILKDLTSQGVAILLISSELPEILALSDRVVVMCNQTVAAEFSRAEATEELILKYASGFEDHVRLKAML